MSEKDDEERRLRESAKEIGRIMRPILEEADRRDASLITESLRTFDAAAAEESERHSRERRNVGRANIRKEADRIAAPITAEAMRTWAEMEAEEAAEKK